MRTVHIYLVIIIGISSLGLSLIMENTVSAIKGNFKRDYNFFLEMKRLGRPTPMTFSTAKFKAQDYYRRFLWICGCEVRKAFFCFPCLLFSPSEKNVFIGGYPAPFKNLGYLAEKHKSTPRHAINETKLAILGNSRINENLDQGNFVYRMKHNEKVKKNRSLLQIFIETVIFLGTQSLAFRGHKEKKEDLNPGNYISLLRLLSKFNPSFTQIIENGTVFKGTSPEFQNDIIDSVCSILQLEIKERIAKAKFVSLMADETIDVSQKSQLAVVVRYVFGDQICETLVGLVDVSNDRTAVGITETLLALLENGLGIKKHEQTYKEKVVGQAYDGANVMSGSQNGVQAKICEYFPYASFMHCCAHKLSLVLRQACEEIPEVEAFFGLIDQSTKFFRHGKRNQILTLCIPKPGDTRWLSRGKTIHTHARHYASILEACNEISVSHNFDGDERQEARGIAHFLQLLPNVFLLHLFDLIFGLSEVVTVFLQKKNLDAEAVSKKIEDYKNNLVLLKQERKFNEMFETCMNLDPIIPRERRSNTRFFRDAGYNPTAQSETSPQTNCKRLLHEIVDSILAQLENRFSDFDKFEWVQLLHHENFSVFRNDPDYMKRLINAVNHSYPFVCSDQKAVYHQLMAIYSDSTVAEIIESENPQTVCDFLKVLSKSGVLYTLREVTDLALLASAIPLTSTSCERTFSALKRIKTYLRNTMSENRLESLMLMSVEKELLMSLSEMKNFYEKVIDHFAKKKERRIELLYL